MQDPATRPALAGAPPGTPSSWPTGRWPTGPAGTAGSPSCCPAALRRDTPGQRRGAAGVPLDAPDQRRRPGHRAARLADRRAAAGRRAAALLPRGGAPLRRRLGVPRRDQPRRDRVRPDRRHLGRRARRGRCSSSRPRGTSTARAATSEDPHDAILAAGRLLRANGFARDPAGALLHYNNSSAYVAGVTLYAEVMQRRPRTYLGYHQWPIYYLTRAGSVWLPEGYSERRPVPVTQLAGARGPLSHPRSVESRVMQAESRLVHAESGQSWASRVTTRAATRHDPAVSRCRGGGRSPRSARPARDGRR